mmetsp:Transcript_110033/g.206274  ORF Transcript_110033/g.206274 Transcript_110033/m.206274 type:complete len:338 (-) Transcript_110033:158-1171(-)
MPLYEEKLINPLAVRFSQDRIWPDFQDGRSIEDSLTEISTVPVKGNYDLVLRPPFPPMEIIRLKQEIREADGERARNDKGQRIYGTESWFTFDNRRLYCLQRAALQLWPMVVAVVVKVLFDFPAVRCARHKFRTTTDGCSVKISLPDGQPGELWTWQEAAKMVQTTPEGESTVMEAVRNDSRKHKKEMLAEPPPEALLAPGQRETTVAERFNSGMAGSQNADGKAAGMQLLSLLKGGGADSNGGADGLAGLFGGVEAHAALPAGAPASKATAKATAKSSAKPAPKRGAAAQAYDEEADDAQGYPGGKGQGGGGSNRNRNRRRKPKGSGKGGAAEKEA